MNLRNNLILQKKKGGFHGKSTRYQVPKGLEGCIRPGGAALLWRGTPKSPVPGANRRKCTQIMEKSLYYQIAEER
jgi:hypothetical protein